MLTGNVTDADQAPRKTSDPQPRRIYLDYQDCKYLSGQRKMLCTGVTEMRVTPEAAPFRMGGVDIVDLTAGRPVHQTPVLLWSVRDGHDAQPRLDRAERDRVARLLMPEDDKSTLYIYEVATE
jgi:hypothetical protein